jgi:hypothetical protein
MVSETEFDQAVNESSRTVLAWQSYTDHDPARAIDPAFASDAERQIVSQSCLKNMELLVEAIDAAKHVVEIAPAYHLANGPRLGRKMRSRKTVANFQDLVTKLNDAYSTIARRLSQVYQVRPK